MKKKFQSEDVMIKDRSKRMNFFFFFDFTSLLIKSYNCHYMQNRSRLNKLCACVCVGGLWVHLSPAFIDGSKGELGFIIIK